MISLATKSRVALVKFKSHEERMWQLAKFWDKRIWWPVYLSAHRDPTLGRIGMQRHYHIAWNRVGKKLRAHIGKRILCGMVCVADDISEFRYISPRIISSPVSPHPAKSVIRELVADYKARMRKGIRKNERR